jgi:hypothetical protein
MHTALKPHHNMTSRTFGRKILRMTGGRYPVLHDSQKVKFLCLVYLCGLKTLKPKRTRGLFGPLGKTHGIKPTTLQCPACDNFLPANIIGLLDHK